jgi:hypothetical protein
MRVWVRWCSVLSLALAAGNCSSQSSGTDTRTNWLMACDQTAECGGEFACLCGVCTVACDDSAACAGLGEEAACLVVDGCRGVAAVCSTPEVEAARRERDASAESRDVRRADAGLVSGEGAPNRDAAADQATFTRGQNQSTTSGAESSAVDTVRGEESSEPSSNEPSVDTDCSPRAADAGLCAPVAVCEAGEVLPTTEPCELTGFVTRECEDGQWVDACVSCQRVALADAALERAIRTTLEKPTGELTLTDAAQLTTLISNNNDITDLSGIECFTNLDFVDLSVNMVSDVAPLGQLPVLTNLGLTLNQVSDLTSLSTLSTLEDLWIAGNAISDLSPLAALTTLQTLGLSDNSISDLAPLQGLIMLTDIDVSYNTFTSIEPLQGLAGLRNLTVGPNPSFDGDLSTVTALTQLEMLFLPQCGLSDTELTPLSGLIGLDYLDLTTNDIVDVAAFSAYSTTTLTLNYNPIDCDSPSLAALEAQNFMTYTDCP